MKKFLFIVLSAFLLSGAFSEENYLESADTGELVELVGQVVPIEQIEIINPTCVVGLVSNDETGGAPCIMYSFWNGNSGVWQNTLGLQLHEPEVISIMILIDKGFDAGAKAVKEWIKSAASKDVEQIEGHIKSIMKQFNKNDKDYALLRPADSKNGIGRTIVLIYSSKEKFKEKGLM